jgi:hypothetical protein
MMMAFPDADGCHKTAKPTDTVHDPRLATPSVSRARTRGQFATAEITDSHSDARQEHELHVPDDWRRLPLEVGRASMTLDVDP